MKLPPAAAVALHPKLALVKPPQLQPVGDGHHRGALRDDVLVQQVLLVGVDCGRGFVQDGEGWGVVKQPAAECPKEK